MISKPYKLGTWITAADGWAIRLLESHWVQLRDPHGEIKHIGQLIDRIFSFSRKYYTRTKKAHGITMRLVRNEERFGGIDWLHLQRGPDGNGGWMKGWVRMSRTINRIKTKTWEVDRMNDELDEQVFIPIDEWMDSRK